MRKLPMILAGLFLAITLARVASFSQVAMRAGVLGWIFSAGLGVAVYASAYFSRVTEVRDGIESRTSRQARQAGTIALVAFALADGYFNLSEVMRVVTDPALQWAAWVYGLFPTLAAALLGWLQGRVDRLPVPPVRVSVSRSFRSLITRWIDGKASRIEVISPVQVVQAALPEKQPAAYRCDLCEETFSGPTAQRQLAAHKRWKHKKVAE